MPPFTVAHSVTAIAVFSPDVAGERGSEWIVSDYRETSTTDCQLPQSPACGRISIKDAITFDPFTGEGLRILSDSNTGRMLGNFTMPSKHELKFTGTYNVAGNSVGFFETVNYDDATSSFNATSSVVFPGGTTVPFQDLWCVRANEPTR